MLGHKKKEQKLFYNISLDTLVPEDNFYRRLSGVLDLSFLYKRCKKYYGSTGNPSIDPVVFFKICLFGYLEGITTDRKLVRKIADTLSGRFFIGYDIDEALPWHSTVSRTRTKLPKELFEELFEMVLGMCVKAGLVAGVKQAIDSTLVKANASIDTIELKKPEMTVVEYIEKTLTENEIEPEEQTSEKEQSSDKIQNNLESINATVSKKTRSNKDYYSPTDPDSRIAKKPGKPTDLYYTDQISVDTKKSIITSIIATHSDKNDNEVLLDVVDKAQKNLKNCGLPLIEIMTDGNYFSAENLKELSQRGIRGYIPSQKPINNKGTLTRDDFKYDKQTDAYTCKAGETLKYCYYDRINEAKIYRATKEQCNRCEFRELCCAGESARRIGHTIHKEYVDDLMILEQTNAYKQAMKTRQSVIERVFAEAKDNHGLRRINTRGLDKAQKVFTMIAIVQNLKKLMKYGGKKETEVVEVKKDIIKLDELIENTFFIFKSLFSRLKLLLKLSYNVN